jgi:3-isopropylmalate/(R)-2-methylmalate dehydratase large subunit
MCLSMNWDAVPAWKRCISTSNRNFVWRQWVWSFTHLASPLMCAISCVTGEVTNPENYFYN